MQVDLSTIAESGYAISGQVFDSSEMEAISDRLVRTQRSRAGIRHAMRIPVVSDLAHDARLLEPVRCVLGAGALPYRATVFDKSSTSNWLVVWHQDTTLPIQNRVYLPGWGPWSIKAGVTYAHAPAAELEKVLALRVHLDDSTPLNGPLRVLPGTHQNGVLGDLDMLTLASKCEPQNCVAPKGAVVAMRPLIVHASSKSRSQARRRVLHIEYVASLSTASGLNLAIA